MVLKTRIVTADWIRTSNCTPLAISWCRVNAMRHEPHLVTQLCGLTKPSTLYDGLLILQDILSKPWHL